MTAPCALLLTNDPLEAYAAKFGAIPDLASLSPAGVFDRVVVAYQAERGGRTRPLPGLTVYRVPARRVERPLALRGAAFAGSFARFVSHTAHIARAERVDLLRAYNPFVQGAVAVLAARLAHRPCVVAVHTDPAETLGRLDPAAARVLRALERFALAGADRVWCVTDYVRQVAISRGAAPERVRVMPNRVDVAEFAASDGPQEAATRARYGIPPDVPAVVVVGRLDPEKDPLTVVRAVARLGRPDTHLLFVGDGTVRAAVEDEARRAGLGRRLVVTGFRPRREIPSLLHLADCSVMASRHEGFPHALIEAVAAGVPVVASDVPQLDEVLAGTGAARFPVGDADALAARLAAVLDDPAGARSAAAAGRARVARFDRPLVDTKEADLYLELLGHTTVGVPAP